MKLRGRARNLQTLLGEISAAISEEEFQQKRNLDGTFCLGFDSQRYETIEEAKRIKKEKDEKYDIIDIIDVRFVRLLR